MNFIIILITLFRMSSNKIDYIMLFDTSGSMQNLYANGYVKQAGQAFLENIKEKNPEKNVVFASFSHIITIDKPITAKDAIFPDYSADPQGMTALYKAVCESVNAFSLSDKGVLLIITDGCNTTYDEYKRDFQETLSKIQKAGWEVCFIGSDQNVVKSGIDSGIPARCCASFDSSKPETLVYLSRAVSQTVSSQVAGVQLDIRSLSMPYRFHSKSSDVLLEEVIESSDPIEPLLQAPFSPPIYGSVSTLRRSVCGD